LFWDFTADEREEQYSVRRFEWISCTNVGGTFCQRATNGSNVIFASELAYFSVLRDSHTALLEDIGPLLNQLNLLGETSRTIVTLFGEPDPDLQTISGFLNYISVSGDLIRNLAHPESIYRRYYQFAADEDQQIAFIVDSLFEYFDRDGRAIYENLTERHGDLVATTMANRIILAAMVDPDSLLDEASVMLSWYLETMAGVTDGYQSWTESEILEIVLSSHFGSIDLNATSTTIYFDDRHGGDILGMVGFISALLEGDSDRILSYALGMLDLDDQFADIVSQTEDVQGLAEAILTGMGLLSERTDESVLENLLFSEYFSQVMANARVGGIDNQDVLGFLASPVSLVGSYERPGEISFVPYYLTIISAMLSFAVGYGLRYFWKKREGTTVDELVNRGLVWKNAPFALKLSLVSVSIGLIFSAISSRAVEHASIMAWMMYVPILITTGILVMTYLARQFPKASLFIVGVIIAAYLLLNPVLGVHIQPGTIVAWLFNISPLQQVERLYANIIAGELLSALGYIALIGLVIVAAVLNLFVREVSTSTASNKDTGGELINETI